MANTYTQIHIQIVFTVQGKLNLINIKHREEIEKYITGIVQNNGHKLLAIYCMPDHVHIMISYRPNQSLSDLVRDIKANSSRFITEARIVPGKFSWQEGYGAFSYSLNDIDAVIHYIRNQEYHHKRRSFKEEYLELLKEFSIEYDEKYLFEWVVSEL
ncbi:MAG: IS200/IS605 family transposase [Bacteroidota bacterium]